MGTLHIQANMDAIRFAMRKLRGNDWLETRELLARRTRLCLLLPSEHPYRGGEFCD
jgi:hypothetical protein